jgi:hypothetical protein
MALAHLVGAPNRQRQERSAADAQQRKIVLRGFRKESRFSQFAVLPFPCRNGNRKYFGRRSRLQRLGDDVCVGGNQRAIAYGKPSAAKYKLRRSRALNGPNGHH